jgi:hypothetical protein
MVVGRVPGDPRTTLSRCSASRPFRFFGEVRHPAFSGSRTPGSWGSHTPSFWCLTASVHEDAREKMESELSDPAFARRPNAMLPVPQLEEHEKCNAFTPAGTGRLHRQTPGVHTPGYTISPLPRLEEHETRRVDHPGFTPAYTRRLHAGLNDTAAPAAQERCLAPVQATGPRGANREGGSRKTPRVDVADSREAERDFQAIIDLNHGPGRE